MEAVTQHWADRTHAQELGVVAQPQIRRQTGKGLVEHKLAIAVALEEQRSHRNRDVLTPEGQMQGLPALLGNDASGAFQGLQPTPAVEGDRGVSNQAVPLLLRYFVDGAMPASRE